MMHRAMTLGLVLAGFAASGCRSEPSPDAEQRATRDAGTADPAAVAADPHAGHAMGDTAAGTPAAGGPAAAAGSAGAAVDHSGHAAAASAAEPRGSVADHAGHQQPAHTAGQSRAAVTDHGGHAAPPAGGRGASSAAAGAHVAADHARPLGHPHAAHAAAPGTSPPIQADAGMQKLVTLVAELVRDSVVQHRIDADPALRQLWREPGVRRILLQRGH